MGGIPKGMVGFLTAWGPVDRTVKNLTWMNDGLGG